MKSNLFLLFGMLLVLFGGTALMVAEDQKGHSTVLATQGVPAKATIKRKDLSRGRRGSATYRLVLINHGAGDAEIMKEVLRKEWDEVEEGETVDIVYLRTLLNTVASEASEPG